MSPSLPSPRQGILGTKGASYSSGLRFLFVIMPYPTGASVVYSALLPPPLRQAVMLLSALGVPDDVLEDRQNTYLQELAQLQEGGEPAVRHLLAVDKVVNQSDYGCVQR